MKDIPFAKGLYAITPDGEKLWSHIKRKFMAIQVTKRGYKRVGLTLNKKQKYFYFHRLVYLTYNGEIPDNMTVDHIDGNKSNNNPSNLQLLTNIDNVRKSILGKPISDETKKKISNTLKGREVWNKGKKNVYRQETLDNWSKVRTGRKQSSVSKAKRSESLKVFWSKPENKARMIEARKKKGV